MNHRSNSANLIDSIKRINNFVSSIREVLPGRKYFIPNTLDKSDPLSFDTSVMEKIISKNTPVYKAIYTTLTGFSPAISCELCERSNINADEYATEINNSEKLELYSSLNSLIDDIKAHRYSPCIIYENNNPVEFSITEMHCYKNCTIKKFDSVSEMLETFYFEKELSSRMRQKSVNLRKTVTTILERDRKKLFLQKKQLQDTEKRENYRIYGELLTAYGYNDVDNGAKSITCTNYYDGNEITIPLDPDFSPIENAKKYFDKYSKLKRTYEALTVQTEETEHEIMHLESISNSIDFATCEADLNLIRKELSDYGLIKKSVEKKSAKNTSTR